MKYKDYNGLYRDCCGYQPQARLSSPKRLIYPKKEKSWVEPRLDSPQQKMSNHFLLGRFYF